MEPKRNFARPDYVTTCRCNFVTESLSTEGEVSLSSHTECKSLGVHTIISTRHAGQSARFFNTPGDGAGIVSTAGSTPSGNSICFLQSICLYEGPYAARVHAFDPVCFGIRGTFLVRPQDTGFLLRCETTRLLLHLLSARYNVG